MTTQVLSLSTNRANSSRNLVGRLSFLLAGVKPIHDPATSSVGIWNIGLNSEWQIIRSADEPRPPIQSYLLLYTGNDPGMISDTFRTALAVTIKALVPGVDTCALIDK